MFMCVYPFSGFYERIPRRREPLSRQPYPDTQTSQSNRIAINLLNSQVLTKYTPDIFITAEIVDGSISASLNVVRFSPQTEALYWLFAEDFFVKSLVIFKLDMMLLTKRLAISRVTSPRITQNFQVRDYPRRLGRLSTTVENSNELIIFFWLCRYFAPMISAQRVEE